MSCYNCLWKDEQNFCHKIKMTISNTSKECPAYTTTQDIQNCHICGRTLPIKDLIIYSGKTNLLICPVCSKTLGSCGICENGDYCAFNDDHSCTEPPLIDKIFSQGNTRMQTTIPNPKRIELTCKQKCKCYSEEFGCLRNNNCCGEYKMKEFN